VVIDVAHRVMTLEAMTFRLASQGIAAYLRQHPARCPEVDPFSPGVEPVAQMGVQVVPLDLAGFRGGPREQSHGLLTGDALLLASWSIMGLRTASNTPTSSCVQG